MCMLLGTKITDIHTPTQTEKKNVDTNKHIF